MTMTVSNTDLATQVASAIEAVAGLDFRDPANKELGRRIEAGLTASNSRWKSLLRTDAAFKLTKANAPDWLSKSLRDTEANLTAHVTAVGELEARLTAVEHRVADHSVTLGLHGADIAKLKTRMGEGWKSQLWIAGALGGIGLALLWMWGVRYHGSQANRWGWAALVGVFGLFIGLAASYFINRPSAPTVVVDDNADDDDDDADPGIAAAVTPPATVAVGTGAATPVAVPTGTTPVALPATAVVPTTTVAPATTVTTTP